MNPDFKIVRVFNLNARKGTVNMDNPLGHIRAEFNRLFDEAISHSGHVEVKADIRWLKKGQKEVILTSAKQYRHILPVDESGKTPETPKEGDATPQK